MSRARRLVGALLPLGAALAVAIGLLLLFDAPPFEALRLIAVGSLGNAAKISDTLMAWVPLALAAAGLVVTFTAGLWNIGVEGQITAGAIAASLVAREVSAPLPILVLLTLSAGIGGGMLWALLAGVLRVYGRVNEIFGGLGLTFVAQSLATFLIIGPWKRAGIASTSGTDPFPNEAWLPTLEGLRLAPIAVLVTLVALLLVYLLLRGTLFGLRLKAVGRNMASAHLLGIPTTRYMLAAFAIGGGLAGLAGAVQATGFHHKLVPAVSGGYGYLGILVALLAGFGAQWVAPIAAFFAMISIGSTQLQLRLDLDSSLGGVLQGVLVLMALLFHGWQARRRRATEEQSPGPEAVASANGSATAAQGG
jgi:simple sugar transport system permease protein